jgi:hypothetical protein
MEHTMGIVAKLPRIITMFIGIMICKRVAIMYVAGQVTNTLVLLQNSKKTYALYLEKKT